MGVSVVRNLVTELFGVSATKQVKNVFTFF